nr:CocE/NonD family hydrolase [Candidatus Freyarchaeota archaeon]
MQLSRKWKVSDRQYNIIEERDVNVTMSDGVDINLDVFRPDAEGKFPALLSMSPYSKEAQSVRAWPAAMGKSLVGGFVNAILEAGPTDFFVRRGYVHIIGSVRGSGKSGGAYAFFSSREIRDNYELVEWAAGQPWCDGNVGMMGISYFAINQFLTAALQPPHLKAIAPIHGLTDLYRDVSYHGGIMNPVFAIQWAATNLVTHTCVQITREKLGNNAFDQAIKRALQDKDISARSGLVEVLKNPDNPLMTFVIEGLFHPTDGPFWRERSVNFDTIRIPTYIAGDYSMLSLHLPGAFRSWENLKVAPKKMVIGGHWGEADRPFYQFHYEMLRWFDYWLKGIDTGIMEEPPVRIFVTGANEWKTTDDWPIPGTIWIPFYLHPSSVLCEMEPWPDESNDSFEDSPNKRGSLKYYSPPLVEPTEVIGPIALNLFASCTASDANFFISLWDMDPEGKETLLTRGWLKGSHREVDPKRSKPWQPFHPHTDPQPLTPGEIYEFNIEVIPTCNLFKVGHRIGLKISGVDDEEPKSIIDLTFTPHLWSQTPKTVTVYHYADYPSHLLLPITKGNIVGTWISGGNMYLTPEELKMYDYAFESARR